MSTIEDLRSEPRLLEKILSYMPWGKLIPLTQIKLFNDVISKSPKLMNRIELRDWKQMGITRNYRNVHIKGNIGSFMDFAVMNYDHLSGIKLDEITISTRYLKGLLTLVSGSLETLEFSFVKFHVDCELSPMTLQKLKYLKIVSSSCIIISLFDNCRLNNFNVLGDICEEEKLALRRFLEMQPNLKKLDLTLTPRLLFTRNQITTIKLLENAKLEFQLVDATFGMESFEKHPSLKKTLESFLKNQKQLKCLKLYDAVIEKNLLEALKKSSADELHLCYPEPKDIVRIPNVRHLVLEHFQNLDLGILLKCFPSVEKLELRCISINFGAAAIIAHEMPHLSFLTLHRCTMDPMIFPTVKTMIIEKMDPEVAVKMMWGNKQLEDLVIPQICREVDFFDEASRQSQVKHVKFS